MIRWTFIFLGSPVVIVQPNSFAIWLWDRPGLVCECRASIFAGNGCLGPVPESFIPATYTGCSNA